MTLMERRRALMEANGEKKRPLWIRPDVPENQTVYSLDYKIPLGYSLGEWERIEYSLIFFNKPFYASCISSESADIGTRDFFPAETSLKIILNGTESSFIGSRNRPLKQRIDYTINRGNYPAGGNAPLAAYYNCKQAAVANIGLCRFAVYTSADDLGLEVIPEFDGNGKACLFDTVSGRLLPPTGNVNFTWGYDI